MSPEELQLIQQVLTGQSTGAPNIGSLLGGAAAAPQAQPTAGMNSLLAGDSSSYNQLLQQQLQQDQMGANPQILQGQQGVQLASIDAANSILNNPAYLSAIGPAAQNWIIDPKSAAATQRDSLIAGGPEAFAPHGVGNFMPSGSPASMSAGMRDWQRAVDNANFWANSSFYGGGLRYKTPEEMQQSQNAGLLAQVNGAKDAMKGVEPRQMVNPEMQAKYASLLGASQASENTLAGTKATADAVVKAAAIKGAADTKTAEVTGKYNVEAEKAKREAGAALQKSTRAKLEQEISGSQGVQANLQNMGSMFNNSWFTLQGRARIQYLKGKDYLSLTDAQDKADLDEWTQFQKQTEQMFNEYRKQITGAAASDTEIEKLRQTVFNMALSPTQAKSALLDLMAEMNMKTTIAQGILQRGLQSGQEPSVLPGTEQFGRMVDNLYNSQSVGENKKAIRAALIKMYPKLDPTADEAATSAAPKYTTQQIQAAIDRRQAAKAAQPGQQGMQGTIARPGNNRG
jgi:hypothetical protein